MKPHQVLAVSLVVAFLAALIVPHLASARGGSGFSSSHSSPSIRTSPRVSAPAPTVVNKSVTNTTVNKTTVIHESSRSGGSSLMTNMLLGGTIGYLIGSHNSVPQQQVVQQAPPAGPPPVATAPTVVMQPYQPVEESHPFIWILVIIAIIVIAGGLYLNLRRI